MSVLVGARTYSASALGPGRPPPASLDVFVVFSMFRLASIIAGVWRRALDGNAADLRAIGYRDCYRDMAERAWGLARRIDHGE